MLLNTATATAIAPTRCISKADSVTIASLDDSHTGEVLAFLNERPAFTFMMDGLIRDNGLENPLNRGTFYACRNSHGRLEGVGLIGEITMVEARTEDALEALARRTQSTPNIYMVIGEREQIGGFWSHYAEAGQEMRLFCREMLFELRCPVEVKKPVANLRPATMRELEELMVVHAEMALEESGINPLDVDPVGFRERCARRIEMGRTWVYMEGERLIFKADIISKTPEITYLEGVHVHTEERGQGYGVRCLSQLSRHLLAQTKSVCVLVNQQNQAAQALYRKAQYKLTGLYDTVFLHKTNEEGCH